MDNTHAVVAFVAFQLNWGLANGFVQRVNQGDPIDLSALEVRLRSGVGAILINVLAVAGFVLGIVLLVRLADPLGWGWAIATLVGSWFLGAILKKFLFRRLPAGLGLTLPGLVALPFVPAFGTWAWFAS